MRLSVGKAAKELGVTPKTIRTYIRDGRLPSAWKLPGGHWRMEEADVLSLRDLDQKALELARRIGL